MPTIEVYGLPGAGKTHFIRERSAALQNTRRVDTIGWGKQAVFFALRHPIVTGFWLKEITLESKRTKRWALWRFKIAILLNTFEKLNLTTAHPTEINLLDEGMLQRILSFYETPQSREKIQQILKKYIPRVGLIVIINNPEKQFIRYEQGNNTRSKLGPKYLETWIQAVKTNHSLIVSTLKDLQISSVEIEPSLPPEEIGKKILPKLFFKKLLFITQKVDQNDDVLGVYHRWIEAFSSSCTQIEVICLYKGAVNLPTNVRVWSLGKEKKESRVQYLQNFFSLIWRLRKDYDSVFVHMNPEYVFLGGILWRMMGKQIWFWYAHPALNWRLRLATFFTNGVVTSVASAFPLATPKLKVVGQGIDTENFYKQSIIGKENIGTVRLLYVARISHVKRLHILLESLRLLKEKNSLNFTLTVVGEPGEKDDDYMAAVHKQAQDLNLGEAVTFVGKIPNVEVAKTYNHHNIFINLTKIGFFDKTTLEAMACELPVLTANTEFKNIFPPELASRLVFVYDDATDLAEKILAVAKLSEVEKAQLGQELRQIIVEGHNLHTLTKKLTTLFFGKSL